MIDAPMIIKKNRFMLPGFKFPFVRNCIRVISVFIRITEAYCQENCSGRTHSSTLTTGHHNEIKLAFSH